MFCNSAPYTKHHLKIVVRQFIWQFYCDFLKFDKLSISVLRSYLLKPNLDILLPCSPYTSEYMPASDKRASLIPTPNLSMVCGPVEK